MNYPAVKNAFVHFHSLLFSNRWVDLTHPSSFTSEGKCWLCSFHTVSLYLPSDLTGWVHVQKCGTVRRREEQRSHPASFFFFRDCVITHCSSASLAFLITAASTQGEVLMIHTHMYKLKHKYPCMYSIMNKYRNTGAGTSTCLISHTVSETLK